MENIELYVPKLDDYWYEEKIENDPLTMSYNAGFNVSYYGYHYDTGCIDFPKGKWKEKYDKRKNKNDFFTDRESAVLFGIPSNLIEGIIVGRIYEKDENILKNIKSILPNSYICNLDGIIIKE